MWLLSTIAFVSFLALCFWGRHDRSTAWWRCAFALMLAALAMMVYTLPAPIILQKLANRITMPCGVIWLCILFVIGYAVRRNQTGIAAALAAVFVLFSVLGNDWIAHRLAASLETPYANINPLETGHYNAVFVLGGGTGTTPAGISQLDWGGDRTMLAARMFNLGQIDYLITTGERFEGSHMIGRDPSIETAEMWDDLGVPSDKILMLDGRNTREEMKGVQKLMAEHKWKRVGVITSASHLSRVLKHAKSAGLELEPLPANFEGQQTPWTELSLIPDSASLYTNHIALKEYLAHLVGG